MLLFFGAAAAAAVELSMINRFVFPILGRASVIFPRVNGHFGRGGPNPFWTPLGMPASRLALPLSDLGRGQKT